MSVFGSSLNRGEQNLRHMAGLGEGATPVSSDIKREAYQAHSTPLSSLVSSAFTGAVAALDFGITGSFLWPVLSMDLRASVIGATPEKVCGACADNAERLSDLVPDISTWISENYEGAGIQFCNFVDSFGIPFKPLNDPSWIGTKISENWTKISESGVGIKITELTQSALSYLDATEKGATCISSIADKENGHLLLCRLTNYAGSVVETAQTMIQHEYAYPAFAAAATGLAIWSFAENYNLPQKSEARAIKLLDKRFEEMVEAFKDKQDEATIDYLAKVDLKDISEGIIENQKQMLKELADLDLPALTAQKRADMIKPIVNLAREHFNK